LSAGDGECEVFVRDETHGGASDERKGCPGVVGLESFGMRSHVDGWFQIKEERKYVSH
jgi:hypothetical protein